MYQKKIVHDNWAILGPKMAHPRISGLALRIFKILLFDWAWSNWARPLLIGSLNSQDMIRILKQWRHDFSYKHLCDGYCMDIMWCLCVKVKIHGFVKLHVCLNVKTYKLPCEEQKITKLDWKSAVCSVVKLSSYFCV